MRLPVVIAGLFLTALLAFAGGSVALADSRSEPTPVDRTAQEGAAPWMYWIDGDTGTIRRTKSDGSGAIEDLIASGEPTSLALDLAAGRLYWTDTNAGKIRWADLNDFSNHHDLYSSERPTSLALDTVNGQLYWSAQVPGAIRRANADGTSPSADILVLEGEPTSLALDLANRDMYWTDGATGKIRRAKMDRSIPDPIDDLATDLIWPDNLALDLAQRQMYWTEWAPGRIRRANLPGAGNSSIEDIENLVVFTSGLPTGLALDLLSGKVYWTDGVNHTIQSSGLTGTGFAITDVFTASDGLKGPEGIAFPAALTAPTVLQSALQLHWVDEQAQKVQRVKREGDRLLVEDRLTSDDGLKMPGSIAVDLVSGKVYWTDDGDGDPQTPDGAIRRVNLDGSGPVENVKAGLADPVGIALDLDAGHVYWADRHHGAIYRSKEKIYQDRLRIEAETLVSGLDKPYQIALDTVKGRMYWTERGGSKIRWADLEGNKVTDLVRYGNPFGLALDLLAGKMYWTERGSGLDGRDLIARADLDGQNIEVLINADPYSLSGITLDTATGKIYWSDETTGSIWSADPDDVFDTTEKVITGLSTPEGLAIARSPDAAPLRALYEVTDGDDWRVTRGWLSDAPIDEWHGVTTDRDGYVTELRLGYNELKGSIPPELGNLAKLTYMALGNNDLVGMIPLELGNLPYLQMLDLSDNHLGDFIGPRLPSYDSGIPTTLGSLGNLETLDLSSNQLTGPILPELGNLNSLETLSLQYNQLTGAIPPELGNLNSLETLSLQYNQLTGAIPPELGNLNSLETLSLQYNQLTGAIPPELGKLDALTRLNLSENGLGLDPDYLSNVASLPISVEVPILADLGNLHKLEVLNLSGNWFGGAIPADLGALPNLEILNLSDNELTWNIPSELGNLGNLRVLDLSGNQLFGPIPPELSALSHICFPDRYDKPIGKLGNLQSLDLSDNALQNEIPIGLCGLTELKSLDLSENFLEGDIPGGLSNLENLMRLELGKNRLGGEMPASLGNLRRLQALNLQGNRLEGDIPSELSNLPLAFLNLYDNDFDTDICIPIRPKDAKRLGVFAGVRGLPDRLCPTPEQIAERQGLELLYQATAQLRQDGEELRELYKKYFARDLNGRSLAICDSLSLPYSCTDEERDLYNLTVSDIDHLSDSEIVALWVKRLKVLGVPDPYRWDVAYSIRPKDEWIVGFSADINDIAGHFRRYAGWKEDWLVTEADISNWHGVTTDGLGRVKGLSLGGNNLIGYIPENLVEDHLPNLQWLDIGGSLLVSCISPDLLRPMLVGDLTSQRPDVLQALQAEGEDPSAWSNEDIYDDLVANLENSGGSNEEPWLTLYRKVLLPQALEIPDQGTSKSISQVTVDAVEDIPADALKKTPRGIFKYVGATNAAKLAGPIIKIANRIVNYTPIKHRVALCAPLPPTDGVTPLDEQNYNTDKQALIALYNDTNGPKWDNYTNWDSNKPLHEWHGVTTKIQGTNIDCKQEELHCRVTGLNLGGSGGGLFNPTRWTILGSNRDGNGLRGTIPPQLGSLGELKFLNLSQNDLSGPIPPELGNLRNLEVLALNDNSLSNGDEDPPIPPELGNLHATLEEFNIQGNDLVGWLPYELSMLSLGDLRKMDMDRGGLGEKKVGHDVTVDCVGGLCGCLPANPSLVAHDEFLSVVNTGVLTALTWYIGGPLTKGASLIGKFVAGKVLEGATRQLSWSVSFRIVGGAGKFQSAALRMGNRAIHVLEESVIKGQQLSGAKRIVYSGIATVLTENALGAFAEPVAKGLKWWDPEIVGPAKERVFNDFQKDFGVDVGGDIVMEGVWCGG